MGISNGLPEPKDVAVRAVILGSILERSVFENQQIYGYFDFDDVSARFKWLDEMGLAYYLSPDEERFLRSPLGSHMISQTVEVHLEINSTIFRSAQPI